jgi:hypothetical protein
MLFNLKSEEEIILNAETQVKIKKVDSEIFLVNKSAINLNKK